jgi:Ca2+-binding RTX toxin-like protein
MASAAVRHAAPGGSGTACTQAAPCDIQVAVEDQAVVNGDEVILAPGTYNIGNNALLANDAINLHGTPGAPRPLINANAGFVAVLIGAFGRLEDVEVRNSAPGIAVIVIHGAVAERMIATSSATNGAGCYLQPDPAAPAVLEGSACIATGAGGTGLIASLGVSAGVQALATMRNVTAVGTGPASIGVKSASSGSGGSVTLRAVNVIAIGTGADASADGGPGGSTAFTQLTFSNYDSQQELTNGTVTDPGHDSNVTGPALLVNPAAGDVHQRPGSWTIDRGSGAAGGADLDGESRFQGAAPDIGADELTVLRRGRQCSRQTATIVASGPGEIHGTPGRDVIIGSGGHDVIDSGGGHDLICSLGGRDLIRAGSGDDRVRAAGAGDKLFGEKGRDRLLGGAGRDRLRGGPGKDVLVGQAGADRLAGGGGRDRCGKGSAKDRASGCE